MKTNIPKCLDHILIMMVTLLLATNRMAFSEQEADTNLHEKIVKMNLSKYGLEEYRRQEIRRGTNLVLSIIWQGKAVTYAFPVGDFVFLEHDDNGDGVFEQISILKDIDVYEAYQRLPNGQINPLHTARLLELQKGCAEAKGMMTNLVDAVTNRNSRKVEQVLESIRKREQEMHGKEQDNQQLKDK